MATAKTVGGAIDKGIYRPKLHIEYTPGCEEAVVDLLMMAGVGLMSLLIPKNVIPADDIETIHQQFGQLR